MKNGELWKCKDSELSVRIVEMHIKPMYTKNEFISLEVINNDGTHMEEGYVSRIKNESR